MMRNVELLNAVADRIEAEPELWDQEYFVYAAECGTAHCIGGWAADLSGRSPSELLSQEMGDLLGLTAEETEFVFFEGMGHDQHEWSHKETAEWLRGIARGDDVRATAPEWWAG